MTSKRMNIFGFTSGILIFLFLVEEFWLYLSNSPPIIPFPLINLRGVFTSIFVFLGTLPPFIPEDMLCFSKCKVCRCNPIMI